MIVTVTTDEIRAAASKEEWQKRLGDQPEIGPIKGFYPEERDGRPCDVCHEPWSFEVRNPHDPPGLYYAICQDCLVYLGRKW